MLRKSSTLLAFKYNLKEEVIFSILKEDYDNNINIYDYWHDEEIKLNEAITQLSNIYKVQSDIVASVLIDHYSIIKYCDCE